MGYCFMSTEKIKSLGAMNRKFQHNYRTSDVVNADESKKELNEELIKLDGENYVDAYNKLIKESQFYKDHAVRKNAVYGIEVMLTYSSEDNSHINIDAWKKSNIEWLQESFGRENVISAMLHQDETCNHIHAIIIPMDEKGQLNAKMYTGGRIKMKELQDSYGEKMMPFGLKRGAKGSIAKHEDIKKYYKTLNDTLDKNIPEIKNNENIDEYIKRISDIYQKQNLKILGLENKLRHSEARDFALDLNERENYERLKSLTSQADLENIIKKAEKYDDLNSGIQIQDYNDQIEIRRLMDALEEKGKETRNKDKNKTL